MFTKKIYLLRICYLICLGMADLLPILDAHNVYKHAKWIIA